MYSKFRKEFQKKNKKLIIVLLSIFITIAVNAQDKKVAVFDPGGSVTNSIREIVREEISSAIVNMGGFKVLEREMIDKVLKENQFQMGGLVDDSQISEAGKRMGANMVFISNLTIMENGNYFISCKMIDVLTASIEKQKTGLSNRGSNDLLDVVKRVVNEMFADISKVVEPARTENKPVIQEKQSLSEERLYADGRKIYQGSRILQKYEIENLMGKNFDAKRLYHKGITRYKQGKNWIFFGAGTIVIGSLFTVLFPSKHNGVPDYSRSLDGVLVGCLLGIPQITTGIIFMSSSKNFINQSVEEYNYGKKVSSTELKLGFTGNGLGVAVKF